MPGLVRKLLIFAAVDGLVLQPAPPRNHKPATEQAIKLDYKSNKIGPLLKDRREENTAANILEVHGIVGLLTVASSSFLISVSRREQVAQIRGKPIYSITEVALIPLSSQGDAEKAIVRARDSQRRHNEHEVETSSSDEGYDRNTEDERDDVSFTDESVPSSPPPESEGVGKSNLHQRTTSVAQDVIQQKGIYGRFTQKWFSSRGWATDNRRNQGMSSEEDLSSLPRREPLAAANPATCEPEQDVPKDPAAESQSGDQTIVPNEPPKEVEHVMEKAPETDTIPLLPKLLTVSKFLFGSKSFYFSYDYDLSRNIANQPNPTSSSPLYRTFDPLFFWNHHLIDPFVEAGQQSFVLPLIQGYVGQRAFTVDSPSSNDATVITEVATKPQDVIAVQNEAHADPQTEELADAGIAAKQEGSGNQFLLTLISRRSIHRAGLRYLRRGVDEEGNVANSVETEQILSSATWDEDDAKTYSFLQCRGSIPLFFSQSPYSLKPVVQMSGSWDQNSAAFRLHFQKLLARYGKIQVASLVEKHGNESRIGESFEKHAKELEKSGNENIKDKLAFEWFDFHAVCRGMRFENVSQLFDILGPALATFAWTIQKGDQIEQKQGGVLRTNCMDCLDRTNVVQSACGRNVLEQQLSSQGISIDLQKDPRTSWFNSVWADNGDAISRQYAGTAALKGDFTRTRKRNVTGALTDFGLTLTRYYNNIVNDYFTQNVIDYILGNVDESIFIDFEADMKAQDYAIDLRKVRQNAIETCRSICIEDENEDLIAGWTLSCPKTSNSLRSLPFEECVVLLTAEALYFCRLDWTTEKVKEFERIGLESVDAIARGTYITSTLAKRELDERKNVGFVLKYQAPGDSLVRKNTRSLGTEEQDEKKVKGGAQKKPAAVEKGDRFLAFKALPPRSSFVGMRGMEGQSPSEKEMIQMVTEQIALTINKSRSPVPSHGNPESSEVQPETAIEDGSETLHVQEKDIISLADARKSTGYLEQFGHSLKKLVWAS